MAIDYLIDLLSLNDLSSSAAAAWIVLVAPNTLSSHRYPSWSLLTIFPVIPFLVPFLLTSCPVGSTHACSFLVKCTLQQWSISILTFGGSVWAKVEFVLTSDYRLRGFITSILLTRSVMLLRAPADSSASSPLRAHSAPRAIIPRFSKPKKLYILSILRLNAWNKPWSPLLLSQVLLKMW